MIQTRRLKWRKTTQYLLPVRYERTTSGEYDIYPAHTLCSGQIQVGFDSLAKQIAGYKTVIIDGYPGVLWEIFHYRLAKALMKLGITACFQNVEFAMLAPDVIEGIVTDSLRGGDPVFGFRYPGSLSDFFDSKRLAALSSDSFSDMTILYGTGAALAGWEGTLVYVDVPKNEIQFRARSRSIRNLGLTEALDPKQAYKRSFFIDWVVANRHKSNLLPRIDWIVDEQRPAKPTFMTGADLRKGLERMAHTFFRARPWFEPGPWGGQWIKEHIPQLNNQVPNYAWSFELITPENGLLFESDGLLLEVSLDTILFQEYKAVLGECAPNFKYEFPIRYDFLDTVAGGNLSVQCHPRPEYIRTHFGETFTQDECYYILDNTPEASVNLGFIEGINPEVFKEDLFHSSQTGQPVEISHYVQSLPSQKHDYFLIPNGTIHGAGIGNLVLEISATPYIFTFKMYDWLRMDLDGKPRQLNIERAFENLDFDRKGERISKEFVSRPELISKGFDWHCYHLPTHPNHFYDTYRYEFTSVIEIETGGMCGSCHVLSLVEGKQVLLETPDHTQTHFHYAETFIVPAATGRYRLISEKGELIKVVVTFIKPKLQWIQGVVPDAQ